MDGISLVLAGITSQSSEDIDQPSACSTPVQPPNKTKKDSTAKKPRVSAGKRKASAATTPRSDRLKKKLSDTNAALRDALQEIQMDANPSAAALSATAAEPAQVPPTATPTADPFLQFKAYMDGQFSALKTDIKLEVSGSIAKLSAQVQNNSDNMKKLSDSIDAKVSAAVNKELTKVNQEIDRIKVVRDTVRDTVSRSSSSSLPSSQLNSNNSQYWRARRSLRCWPLPQTGDVWSHAGDFFHKILAIPTSNLTQDSVEDVRRICSSRNSRSRVRDEVLVVFKDVPTRDMVVSFASNLANYRNEARPPGIRPEVPDSLRGVFQTLDSYAVMLKKKTGPQFRRSIKFQDSDQSMFLDVCFPGDSKWSRISFEIANEEVKKARNAETNELRDRLSSITSSDTGAPPIPMEASALPPPVVTSLSSSAVLTSFTKNQDNPPARWTQR